MSCSRRLIFLITIWNIWKWHNQIIFESKREPYSYVIESILCLYGALNRSLDRHQRPKVVKGMYHQTNAVYGFPRAYFDGAAQNNICACGVYIITQEDQAIELYWNGSPGTNSKAEIMALAGLIYFSDFLGIQNLHIYGDSKVTIDHVQSRNSIKNIHLSGWLSWIEKLWHKRKDFSISHIGREKNSKADALSKLGLSAPQGVWRMQVILDNISFQIHDFQLPGA